SLARVYLSRKSSLRVAGRSGKRATGHPTGCATLKNAPGAARNDRADILPLSRGCETGGWGMVRVVILAAGAPGRPFVRRVDTSIGPLAMAASGPFLFQLPAIARRRVLLEHRSGPGCCRLQRRP